MPNEEAANKRLVREMLRASQEKSTHFMLVSSGACIGFAFTQTTSVSASWALILVLLAVAAWGISFFCGTRYIDYVNSTLYANAELLEYPPSIEREELRKITNNNSEAANTYYKRQKLFLFAGAGFFISWRIVEIALK